ncbi:uncharacterized protein H6S33_002352 [Morchella sextelata]|uniref:uncharacterized protein n=1 Tax=Morchella sextelata TaxID=1174677 RepID=UPI001D0387AB|nr:uncharacterized protein H6S33_002352 [Morchella sextelata]KAH0608300.1 hypothetical protein H6S33_002352 [Morchella sextelata]
MMVRLPAAAAFLALSVHVLPAIGFAFPSPQTSANMCTSECSGLLDTVTECNISTTATTYTATQERCMCNSSSFKSTIDQCFACMGEVLTYQDMCSAYLSSSTSSASRSATKSASASSASASATRTTSASSSRATQSASATCGLSDACVAFVDTLSGCNINVADIQNSMTDAQMGCLCKDPATFEANTANCIACTGETVSGIDKMCDSYASSSGLASGTASRSTTRATSTARTTNTGSSGATTTAAIAANPTTTSTGSTSTSTSTSGSTGGTGNALSQNGGSRAVALGVPGLAVPVLMMAAAAWRVVF